MKTLEQIAAMSADDKDKEVAAIPGLPVYHLDNDGNLSPGPHGQLFAGTDVMLKYSASLDAMAEAQSVLLSCVDLRLAFLNNLREVVHKDYSADVSHPCAGWTEFATAEQRETALIFVMQKEAE